MKKGGGKRESTATYPPKSQTWLVERLLQGANSTVRAFLEVYNGQRAFFRAFWISEKWRSLFAKCGRVGSTNCR